MDEERRLQIALHRYAAIDRLVEAEIPPGGQASVLRALAAEHGHHPDTLWRWAHRFQQGGLDGLKPPARRADAGALRGLTPEMLTLAVRLREEEPRRSTATLIALLESRKRVEDQAKDPVLHGPVRLTLPQLVDWPTTGLRDKALRAPRDADQGQVANGGGR